MTYIMRIDEFHSSIRNAPIYDFIPSSRCNSKPLRPLRTKIT